MKLARPQVALGILAGGRASRMGGADKAMVLRGGERLLDRTLSALDPENGDGSHFPQTLVSHNAEGGLPAGLRRVSDLRPGFPGPLAGIEAMLAACEQAWLLSVPVDLDCIPEDLFERLRDCAREGVGASARDADGAQPLVALWPVRESRARVAAALDAGEGAVHRVQAALGFSGCDFSPFRFGNLNTPAELQA